MNYQKTLNNMAIISTGAAIAIGASSVAVAGIGAAVQVNQANKAAKGARNKQTKAEAEIQSLKDSRQTITNPYEGTRDLSALAGDLSSNLSNPFASLGVATGAAEIQMEQADIALANTLDTLRSTGASAGGATALAQAALQSKKGVAANIEQQEVANEKLRAQGEQQLQGLKMSEQQRQQNIAISEGQRVQAADAAGQQFEFQAQENRTNSDLNRAAGKQNQAMQQESDANMARASAIGGFTSAIGNMAGSFASTATIKPNG